MSEIPSDPMHAELAKLNYEPPSIAGAQHFEREQSIPLKRVDRNPILAKVALLAGMIQIIAVVAALILVQLFLFLAFSGVLNGAADLLMRPFVGLFSVVPINPDGMFGFIAVSNLVVQSIYLIHKKSGYRYVVLSGVSLVISIFTVLVLFLS